MMKHPQYRRLRFDRTETVPFQWDPANPLLGLWESAVSLVMVCWQKYMSAAFQDALESVEDPCVPVAHYDEHAGANRKFALCVFGCSAVAVALLAWVCRRGVAPITGGVPARRAERSCGEI